MPMNRRSFQPRSQRGFSLIEVLIALVVLAFGMLGFALMQTMGVRFAQSSNYRTQATNLAADMLDQMRSNRLLAAQYSSATFTGGTAVACPSGVGTVTIATNITRWQCRVRWALGDAAAATVTYNNGQATVTIRWDDQRWERDAARKAGLNASGQVTLGARL